MEKDMTIIEHEDTEIMPSIQSLQSGFSAAYQLVDDVVLKNYITKLTELSIVPLDDEQLGNSTNKIRLFKITEMVYEKDESATYKFASVFNAVAATNSAIVAIIDSDGIKTDFYLGIRSLSDENSTQTSFETLEDAMKGQFPGTKIDTDNLQTDDIEKLLASIPAESISVVSCVANNKNEEFTGNDEYLQGLEKLALAMQGKKYTAVILANSTTQGQLNEVRQGYESIYTQLSPYANVVSSYGTNTSSTETRTETESENDSKSDGTAKTLSQSEAKTENCGEVQSQSQQTIGSKIGSTIGATLSIAGALIGSVIPGPGTAAGAAAGKALGAVIGSAVGNLAGSAITAATNKTVSKTTGGGSVSTTQTESETQSSTITHGTSHSLANSLGLMTGESQNLQLTIQNKSVISMLDRIDKQLTRLSEFESVGMWECAAYFLSTDSSVSKVAAATYKALMSGENTGLEVSAINTWNETCVEIIENEQGVEEPVNYKDPRNQQLVKYVRNFIHPVFSYNMNGYSIPVTPTSLVSGNELAIHMGLPRHSVSGFPVIEHADFGKEIVKYEEAETSASILLGNIYNMGRVMEDNEVLLDVESLAMHTFVVGATGSGKSNTIYKILERLTATRRDSMTYMVIEPAKGEYKRAFGHRKDVSVFGTNPEFTHLLKINPFKFPKGIHVLEHIDRLIEIFNVCWPLYAAMPAVLKDAVLSSYSMCGWDLTISKNSIADDLYPTFQDLLEQLVRVIDESGYSDEVKSNYIGSLTTRVKSLTNGLNGQIFSSNEISNDILFDSNVIVDLSRVGSQETKSLLMGILVMRLSEHRMSNAKESNSKLRHITVLEEAHNLLGSKSDSNNIEGSNITGKSVEMLSNAIAEMRTYGEGFIIADQSPGAVDISAIRNTNTKIIMRLPEENDRRISGKAAALKDNQVDEIARLPKGVAVVYQNDWVEPVLCKIDKFDGKEEDFIEPSTDDNSSVVKEATSTLFNFIAYKRLDAPDRINTQKVLDAIQRAECTVRTKTILYSLLKEYKNNGQLRIWSAEKNSDQAKLATDILGLKGSVEEAQRTSFDNLGFSCRLNTMIAQKLSRVTDDILITASHYLVKAYSETESNGLEFYKQWVETILHGRDML